MDGPEADTIIRTSSGNVSGQYNNWASGQPDGADYVYGNWTDRRWDDYPNQSGHVDGYIIEYGSSTSGIDTPFNNIGKSTVTFTRAGDISNSEVLIPIQTANFPGHLRMARDLLFLEFCIVFIL